MANAILARRLGVRRLFLLEDGSSYGSSLTSAVRVAAGSLGIHIVGTARWNPQGNVGALTRRVGAAHPDGVFVGGLIGENGNELLKRLRKLGPRLQMLLPDGFTPFRALLDSGAAVEGDTVTFPGPAPSRLAGYGGRFVRSFAKAIGAEPDPYSVTAAQAAEAMLAAIARSDGTRASVATHLLGDPVTNGILGSFRFDANGDTTQALVSVFRIVHGAPRLYTVITAWSGRADHVKP
jgi:branched-chain amino acid transport system substrate-binding protein